MGEEVSGAAAAAGAMTGLESAEEAELADLSFKAEASLRLGSAAVQQAQASARQLAGAQLLAKPWDEKNMDQFYTDFTFLLKDTVTGKEALAKPEIIQILDSKPAVKIGNILL